jgi:hypothetical protein
MLTLCYSPTPSPLYLWNHRLSGKSMSNLWGSITYGQNLEPQRVTLFAPQVWPGRAAELSSDVWVVDDKVRYHRLGVDIEAHPTKTALGRLPGRTVVHRTSSGSLPVCDAGTRRFAPRGGRMRPPLHFAADAATGVFGRSRIGSRRSYAGWGAGGIVGGSGGGQLFDVGSAESAGGGYRARLRGR